MTARVLRNVDYRRVRWKNDGGWTTEIAVALSTDARASVDFDWRISIADIETTGDFSTFDGCDRSIALLHGAGMELQFAQAPSVRLEQRLEFFSFAGEWNTRGVLIAGAVRDFNVMTRRAACSSTVLHRPLVGPMVFLPDAGVSWLAYIAAGSAEIRLDGATQELETGESLLLTPDGDSQRQVLSGGGEVVLVKLSRAPQQ